MISRVLILSLGLLIVSQPLHAQTGGAKPFIERAEKGYRARGIGWTAGGIAAASLGLGAGIPLLATAGDACRDVSGECWAGFGDLIAGASLIGFFVPMGALFLTKGIYSLHQASVFDDMAKEDSTKYAWLLKEENDSARTWRYIGGGIASFIGFGSILTALVIEATQSDDFSGGSILGTAVWFSPFSIMGLTSLLMQSPAENAYDDYRSSRTARFDYDIDIGPTVDGGIYTGLRLRF